MKRLYKKKDDDKEDDFIYIEHFANHVQKHIKYASRA